MNSRQLGTALSIVLIILSSSTVAAETERKGGVRLMLDGSRLAGWAAPEVVDWDNDGLNDVLVGHYSGELHLYLNRGYGKSGIVFEQTEIVRQDGWANAGGPIWGWRFNKANCVCPGPGRISPRVFDWDRDGKKDLVIGDGVGAQIRVWKNIGTDAMPVFSTHHLEYLPPDAGVRPYHESVQPYLADWNADGKVDLLMGRNRGVYVYLNEGTDEAPKFDFDRSRFGEKIRDVFPIEQISPIVLDWNEDGKQDLLVGSESGDVWLARNIGTESRPEFNGYTPVQAGGKNIHVGSEARIAVADLDGDELMDVLVGADNGVVWFFQAKNPNPVARSQRLRVRRAGSIPVKLLGTDDAGRSLSFNILTQPQHGTLSGEAPNLTYTPNEDYAGFDEFTFAVGADSVVSKPAKVIIDVLPADTPPTITTQPVDELVGPGQPASFQVTVSGTPPFTYEWKLNDKVVQATGPEFVIRESNVDDRATVSVTITNAAGSVTSRIASLHVKPFPAPDDQVPVIDIKYKSPVIEPATPGVLTLTRTGNTAQAVTVKLLARRGHHPVIADLHYVPIPPSITLEAGQTTADVLVMPIDDTLVNGNQSLTFLIVPSPAYRLATQTGATNMIFLDDDCPLVEIRAANDANSADRSMPTFQITALPAPRRNTVITYSVSGTAIAGVDYEPLPGTVTIPAGKTSSTIVVKPYRQVDTGRAHSTPKKTVVLKLPPQPFTYFDFYAYLTQPQPAAVSVELVPSASSNPAPPATDKSIAEHASDVAVARLRHEVSRLGWIVFAAPSAGPHSDLDLFVMRPDGSSLRNITKTPTMDEYSARVSPDGKRMLYRQSPKTPRRGYTNRLPQDVGTQALRTRPPVGTLVIANADGSKPKPLGTDGQYAWASWGPAGDRFACLEPMQPTETPANSATPQNPPQQIVIRETETLKVVQSFRSVGIHNEAIWSPDGKYVCGATDMSPGTKPLSKGLAYPLGIGKIASLDVQTGRRTAMSLLPDWNPVWATDSDADWFQGGSPEVLHSANNYRLCPAYYCMLWRSGLDGQPSHLIYGEYGRHVLGGCTSPDDKYAVFVISGETWPVSGKLAIVRLADAPIARGRSTLFHEVLADYYPTLKEGPVLDLIDAPEAFDPHWTMAEMGLE